MAMLCHPLEIFFLRNRSISLSLPPSLLLGTSKICNQLVEVGALDFQSIDEFQAAMVKVRPSRSQTSALKMTTIPL